MSAGRQDVLRILDASYNRMREALRVIEDAQRFIHNDPGASAACKTLRHQLHEIVPPALAEQMLAARGTEYDVGREIKTDSEATRENDQAVLRAAIGRLTEAARSFAEFAKQLPETARTVAAVEQLRYQAYALEQRLLVRTNRMQRFMHSRLYLILTASLCRASWRETLDILLAERVGVVQVREKDGDDGLLRERAAEAREATGAHDCLLIINDRPDIARLVQADGVHVGQDDLSVADVRQVAGGDVLVGKSTHSLQQYETALAEQPDYLAVGPMYPTTTKPQDHIAGVETLARARALGTHPIVAIGGITPERTPAVLEAGASHICVCSAVISAEKPAEAVRAFQALL